jgi:hypothetical protein
MSGSTGFQSLLLESSQRNGMRKYKKLGFLTIIFVSFCFPAISIYLDYDTLVEADFLLGGFQFEAPDLQDFLAEKQNFHLLSVQAPLPNLFEVVLFSCILASFWQEILSGSKSFILRC